MPALPVHTTVLRQAAPICWDDLALRRSKSTCAVARQVEQCTLRDTYRISGEEEPGEALVLEFRPKLAAEEVNEIRAVEPVLIVFREADSNFPEVYALRADFERGLSHLNNHNRYGLPQLCLYSDPWADYKAIWTPLDLLYRIFTWFSRTRDGTLDDALADPEPLMLSASDDFIYDPDDLSSSTAIGTVVHRDKARSILACAPGGHGERFIVFKARTEAVEPTSIHAPPRSFDALENLLGDDGRVREHLRRALEEHRPTSSSQSRVVLHLTIPIAARGVASSRQQTMAFLFSDSADVVSNALLDRARPLAIEPLNPVRMLSARDHARLSGIPGELVAKRFAVIGAGALGSTFLDQMARMGLGSWRIIDDDHLLPHNLVRHALWPEQLGAYKAAACASVLGRLHDESRFTAITERFAPAHERSPLIESLQDCDAIVDLSGSLAVARELACGKPDGPRRACGFCTPSGRDGVFMLEDAARKVRLDALEAQYYRWLLTSEMGSSHLHRHVGTHRYGGSCRDVTTIFAADLAQLHASMIAVNFRACLPGRDAHVKVWRVAEDGAVTTETCGIRATHEARDGSWTVVHDDLIAEGLSNVSSAEAQLLGYWDIDRRRVYVVALAIPMLTIDGQRELARRTAGIVEVVGTMEASPRARVPGTPIVGVTRSPDGRLDWRVHETLT